MPQPYPGDQWVAETQEQINALYTQVGRPVPLDLQSAVWIGRTLYDIGNGLSKEASRDKHLRELRQELGLPNPNPPFTVRQGVVRLEGRVLVDDDGAFNALGASLFWLAWAYRHDRHKLELNLTWLRDHGFHYVRALGMVGVQPWWSGREIDPNWPDYMDVIEGVTRLCYEQFGMRVEWTLFADAQVMMPQRDARRAFARMFAHECMRRDLLRMIMHFEVANEGWQNGFPGGDGVQEMRELAREIRAEVPASFPIGISAPDAVANEVNDGGAEIDGMYGHNSPANFATYHFSRDTSKIDREWRAVRQPWEADRAGSNNEPIGPGSSVAADDEPLRIVAGAIVTYVARLGAYVYHSEAGVWGGLRGPANLYEHQRASEIAAGLQAMTRYLPQGLANWDRTRHGFANHPCQWEAGQGGFKQIWPDGITHHGVVRPYCSLEGNRFVCPLIGIRDHFNWRPSRAQRYQVLDVLTGAVLEEGTGPTKIHGQPDANAAVLVMGTFT